MAHRVVSTFDPERLKDNRYTLVFDNLRKAGVELDILPHPDPESLDEILSTYKERLKGADMVVHLPGFFFAWAGGDYEEEKDLNEFMAFYWAPKTHPEKVRRFTFKKALDKYVTNMRGSGVILDADVFLQDEGEVETILDGIGSPGIKRMTVDEWEANKFFPAVFRMKDTSQGKGIYFLETDDQFRKMFDPEYIVGDNNSTSGRFSNSRDYFDVREFVECPSDHYTHCRVFTLGDGTILGAVLSYSASRKSEDERIAFDDVHIRDVYGDIKSPLFLNRRKIVSNKGSGGNQIPLNPNDASREITNYERGLLEQHGITDQQIPAKLAEQATLAAKAFGEKGVYVLGQDWIQGKDGRFYCLEVNAGAEFGIFGTLYNHGHEDEEAARTIAAEKIANGILSHLDRKAA
jgi:hypothetical protein